MRGLLVHLINFMSAKSHFKMNDLVTSLPRETDSETKILV